MRARKGISAYSFKLKNLKWMCLVEVPISSWYLSSQLSRPSKIASFSALTTRHGSFFFGGVAGGVRTTGGAGGVRATTGAVAVGVAGDLSPGEPPAGVLSTGEPFTGGGSTEEVLPASMTHHAFGGSCFGTTLLARVKASSMVTFPKNVESRPLMVALFFFAVRTGGIAARFAERRTQESRSGRRD